MGSNRPAIGSGEGTRPTTSGGVDNIGGGESFSGKKTAANEDVSGPAPRERMRDKQKNVESTKHDDSAAFGLTEDLASETNREPAEDSQPAEANPREEAIRRAAYEAYQRRGGVPGREQEDWLEAEAQIDRDASKDRT
ncbi:hypothetical protein M2282_000594 [Variovorax boronicumulans]|uniref:DUF2934 domain-containing protein n=1 Tax=Variovorax boronicumulans TaxID=436515 RepID=UPI002477041A|nr:DUF2934 domain-containing protein [Variovorax boronicumulans]MDH6165466.1 hypothetical protein [Variovorax boronicumulans]